MAEARQRPTPKQRSRPPSGERRSNFGHGNPYYLGSDVSPLTEEMYSTREVSGNMSRPIRGESFSDTSGLPSCVKLYNTVVSEEQKSRNSALPRLLHDLDEACKHGANDTKKGELAFSILHAASSPVRKYRLLRFYELLENNKDGPDIYNLLPGALTILEKYATNLLKEEKHHSWKIVKFNLSIIQNSVSPVMGAVDVLEQMGYTERTGNALTFPNDINQPDIETVVILASDLVIARFEVDALFKNKHPFLIFLAPGNKRVMSEGHKQSVFTENNATDTGNDSISGNPTGGFCGVCSGQNLTKSCKECDMLFCQACDERWHSHVLRRSHVRSNLANSVLGIEGVNRPRPVPVPRQRKVQQPKNTESKLQAFQNIPSGSPATNRAQERLITSNGTNILTIPPRSDLLNTSPGLLDIKRPPPWQSTGISPGNVNRSVSPATFAPSPQISRFSPSFPDQTSGNTQLMTAQSGQTAVKPRQDDLFHKENTSVTSPDKEVALSCPNCFLLVSSAQPLCPSCQHPIGQGPPASPDLNKNRAGLPQTTDFPLEINSPSKILPNLGNLEDIKRNPVPASKEHPFANRKLPDLPIRMVTSAYLPPGSNSENLYEEVDPQLKHSKKEWSCEHCTFLNPITTQVCLTCCRTPSDLKNHPANVTSPVPFPQATRSTSSNPKNQVPPSNEGNTGLNVDTRVPVGIYGALQDQPRASLFMTPKDLPLEGGIYMAPTHPPIQPPPLPPKKNNPEGEAPRGTAVLNAQKLREQELEEKKKGKREYEEKLQLWSEGKITEEEFYDSDLLQLRKVFGAQIVAPRADPEIAARLISPDVMYNNLYDQVPSNRSNNPELIPGRDHFPNKTITPEFVATQDDNSLSDEQLLQLIKAGGMLAPEDPYGGDLFHGSFQLQKPNFPEPSPKKQSSLTYEERLELYQAGLLPFENLQDLGVPPNENNQRDPSAVPKPDFQADIKAMFDEFQLLEFTRGENFDQRPNISPGIGANYGQKQTTLSDIYNYRVTRDTPVYPVSNYYDKIFPKNTNILPQSSQSSFMSLQPNYMENLGSYGFLEEQGRMYIEWMKQAEIHGFTPEELNLATNLSWQDPKGRDPVEWLQEEWTSRLAKVMGRVTEQTSNENDRIGNISAEEAKEALLENHGSVQSACKSCIESRREKLAKMAEIAVYGRADCLNALDNNNGNLENALLELELKALEPMRRRILEIHDSPDGGDRSRTDGKLVAVVSNKDVSFERRARVLFAETKLKSWGRAETAIKLIDMNFSVADAIEAAEAYGDMERSLNYLQKECPVCLELKPMGQMITFLSCQDLICKICVADHLTVLIRESNIHRLVCPVCGLPDLSDEAEATEYFNNLDIMMRHFVDEEVHDLFQQKLRDRTLRKEPNFRWCAHCSYGFINEDPRVNKMGCPACRKFTCFSCKKQWEPQHEGVSCEDFARWKEENDEEYQAAGLAGHLARHGIDCPGCKFRYDLAKGGCMHFKCIQCAHEFCSGCNNPFKHGARCNVSPNCANKGIHAHHPRDCLFYLRDWNPGRLQNLLNQHGVDYNIAARELHVQGEQDENEDEVVGAVGGAGQAVPRFCKVPEQKETPNGLEDAECGAPCEDGHEGLCKVHYTEYLVGLVNRNHIDPADLMNVDEIMTVLRRAEIEPPRRDRGEDEGLYRERILNNLKQSLPLVDEEPPEDDDEQPQPLLV